MASDLPRRRLLPPGALGEVRVLLVQCVILACVGWFVWATVLDWTVDRLVAEAKAEAARVIPPPPGQCNTRI